MNHETLDLQNSNEGRSCASGIDSSLLPKLVRTLINAALEEQKIIARLKSAVGRRDRDEVFKIAGELTRITIPMATPEEPHL